MKQTLPSFFAIVLLSLLVTACDGYHRPDARSAKRLNIYPDYTGVTLPCNLAPTNFEIQKAGEAYQTEVGITGKEPEICITDNAPAVSIPQDDWRNLLSRAAGRSIYFRISIREKGKWTVYADLTNSVSRDTIDRFLVYRLLYPGYELWNEMGIYQRDLTTYEQTPIMENRKFDHQCVNCHSFSGHNTENMMVHIRGRQGGTLIYNHGNVEKIESKTEGMKNGATYPAWHPDNKHIAFSTNEIQQFFHSAGTKPIEVADLAADLIVYDVQRHRAMTDRRIYNDQYYETFPCWSPDGRQLYFCQAKAIREGGALDSIRYDLCRIGFDARSGRFGEMETLFQAAARGKSASFPVVSPDGRYLLFTLSDYGSFTIWHPESDLWLLDLTTGKARSLAEANSPDVDSWHGFSSTGRWIVLSSKRMDGGWARPWFAHFDPQTGRATKPFVLPQQDPRHYDAFTYTYNRPELIIRPVTYGDQLVRAISRQGMAFTLSAP